MKMRAFVQVSVAAIVLFVLFGAIYDPAEAKTNSYTPFRAVEKRTTLIDGLTMTTSGLAIVPSNGGTRQSVFHPPLQGERSGPDWLIQLTVVVIVMGLASER